MLAVLAILGGSLSAFAKPPRRAQVYGKVVDGDDTLSTHNLKIAPINNNVFGVYQDSEVYTGCVNLYLYFLSDTTSIESFRLRFRLLSTSFQLRDLTAQTSANKQIINMVASSGAISGYINIKNSTAVSISTDENGYSVLEYTYFGNSAERNAIALTIPFNTFVLGSSPMYWEVLEFSINGESTGLTYSDQQLSEINEAINEDVPLPSAVPSLEEIGGEIVNEGLNLAQSWVQYFTTNFDIAGAMGRVVKPFSDYFLVMPSDGNPAHITLVVIMLFSLGAVLVVWLINKLKRRQDDA